MLRVFIAVDVEDPLLVSRIERVKESLASTGVPMKLVESYNLHVTLRFIGEVGKGVVDGITSSLRGLKFKAFPVKFKGLGAFPNNANPRVVWIGVSEGLKEFSSLRDEVEKILGSLGLPRDREEFIPHLTLARIKGGRNIASLTRLLEEMSDYELGIMIVDRIRLKRSVLTRQGPIYETLLEVKAL